MAITHDYIHSLDGVRLIQAVHMVNLTLESVKLFHPVLFLFQLTSSYATPTTNPDCFKLPSKMIGCCCAIAPPLCSQQQPLHCVFNNVCKAQPEVFHFCSTGMAIDNSNMIATSICCNLIGQSMVLYHIDP